MVYGRLACLLLSAITAALPSTIASAQSASPVPVSLRLLAGHNAERARYGITPLIWDPALAIASENYAASMASTGNWGHSPKATRVGQGENLWMGTRSAFPVDAMIGAWLSERSMFRAGVFPAVTTTGNWADVGHYTQIISRRSTHVGCAIRANRSDEYLVCRYSPSGNLMGASYP